MTKKIVIAGSGFAGMWAAVSAARAVALAGREQDVEITIVSPSANLTVRPRLYEAVLENMNPDLAPLFEAVGVRHIAGLVQTIDAGARRLAIEQVDGTRTSLPYDKFVLATEASCSSRRCRGWQTMLSTSISLRVPACLMRT